MWLCAAFSGLTAARPRTIRDMARPSRLENPDFCKQVAELMITGMTRQEIADELDVGHLETITRWRRDPRVKVIALKLIEDRTIQISRRVDSRVEAMLRDENLTLKELLAVRKEYLGGQARAQSEKADAETVNEATEMMGDPDELEKFLQEMTAPSDKE